jgi:hypothetical protein
VQKNGYEIVSPFTAYAETDFAYRSLMPDGFAILRLRWQRQNDRLTTTLAFCDNAKRGSLDSRPLRVYPLEGLNQIAFGAIEESRSRPVL